MERTKYKKIKSSLTDISGVTPAISGSKRFRRAPLTLSSKVYHAQSTRHKADGENRSYDKDTLKTHRKAKRERERKGERGIVFRFVWQLLKTV